MVDDGECTHSLFLSTSNSATMWLDVLMFIFDVWLLPAIICICIHYNCWLRVCRFCTAKCNWWRDLVRALLEKPTKISIILHFHFIMEHFFCAAHLQMKMLHQLEKARLLHWTILMILSSDKIKKLISFVFVHGCRSPPVTTTTFTSAKINLFFYELHRNKMQNRAYITIKYDFLSLISKVHLPIYAIIACCFLYNIPFLLLRSSIHNFLSLKLPFHNLLITLFFFSSGFLCLNPPFFQFVYMFVFAVGC